MTPTHFSVDGSHNRLSLINDGSAGLVVPQDNGMCGEVLYTLLLVSPAPLQIRSLEACRMFFVYPSFNIFTASAARSRGPRETTQEQDVRFPYRWGGGGG